MASPDTTTTATATSLLNLNELVSNPVFAGGFGLASLGAVLAFARKGVVSAGGLLRRRMLVNVEISRQDPAYPWVLAWLSEPRQQTSFLAKKLTRINKLSVTTTTSSTPNGPTHASFFLQPGYGRHIVHYKGAYIAVNREKQSTAKLNTGEPHETLELTTLYSHRHIFEHVFTEARQLALQAHEGKTVVYSVRNFDWVPLGQPRIKRPLHSVVLDKGVKEGIVADVRDFLNRRSWYADRGIPYRRGYLLYGPPGSGKSSFIQALAGELDYGVAMVNLSEVGVTDDKLAFLLTKLPERTILLLEDADSAFVNRRRRDEDGYAGGTVTFSGLLNALDGLSAGEERIAFLTTNHIERLDPALIRPGRVDLMLRIGEASRYQAGQMWDRFYGDVDTQGVNRERFLKRLDELGLFSSSSSSSTSLSQSGEGESGTDVAGGGGEKPIGPRTSTAAIQGLFLFNKNDIEGAIAMAEHLIPKKIEAEPQP
ncbi:BCS1 N terminal-domain-containing protein [Microdochium trichocladiopsis]|uniref:BCS1 N terminal-domain-containing protein n=1 Tax=Microdochium trichocladiopsis TaxID=1682393 RepID=A0A9P8YFW8_9PEZI|nr:BCS1 N terminal-domain-containing protein [Microdochium trichocladiopsis]KAH7039771.1 BCS1 N terminal-domain-containing protein [Microdochium trichocladiopsis]